MKLLRIAFAAILGTTVAWAAPQAVNTDCPVKQGTPAKASITSNYKGKTVAFCCGNCKGQFDATPEKFISNIPALAGPQPRTGLSSFDDVVKEAKAGTKPALVLFGDAGPKTKQWTLALGETSLDECFGKISYAFVEFKKDGETEKKFKITAAPSLILLDVSKDEPKEIKKLTSPAPASVKKEIEAAVKKLATAK